MVRLFFIAILFVFFFIIYYVVKTLLTANKILRTKPKKENKKSRYKDIEEADYKEIETKKNDKDVQE
jgi:phosphotransferase system  glucose/maltose/N-acetylglucosamine-specific IIC component